MSDPCGIVETIQNTLIPDPEEPLALPSTATAEKEAGTEETANNETGVEIEENPNEEGTNEKEEESSPKKKVGGGLLRGWGAMTKTTETEDAKRETGGGILRGWRTSKKTETEEAIVDEPEEEEKDEEPPKMAAISDLSDPSRNICIVTTAGLPWRTGTAVNPLARALYLTRGRPKDAVTLMIPWLESLEEQAKVYGSNTFETPEEQEEWIRNYSRERILNNEAQNEDEDDEVDNLQIRFYPAKYHALFGSIFATVDICALIPQEEADVAILEEPEHLTWFRSLPPGSGKSSSKNNSEDNTSTAASAMSSMMDNDNSCGSCAVTGSTDEGEENANKDNNDEEDEQKKLEEQAIIGWTAKFTYVVGILHTNYSAYMRQYGLGASIVTASALQALSSVCVRAYTHKLIRLSDTLPELDRPKEITCNVHGVRSEFFLDNDGENEEASEEEDEVVSEVDPNEAKGDQEEIVDGGPNEENNDDSDNGETASSSGSSNKMTEDNNNCGNLDEEERFVAEPIYFIGKVIWAKGFDKLLEIEELYRKQTGDYFPIDIYGSGGDYDAISRAFLGRSGLAKRVLSSESVMSMDSTRSQNNNQRDRSNSPENKNISTPEDQTAALLFSRSGNLRGQIEEGQTVPSNELVVEVQTCETPSNADSPKSNARPIISHLGEKTIETGTGVTKAIASLSEKISNLGLRSLYREESQSDDGASDEGETSGTTSLASKFRFDPPKSRCELRRHSIPARFLGVKDHAILRDIPGHKIFINLSITEVLCTTTAEAMAMGKFVIIPKHPSNTFFLQFPNCLAYESKKECVEKIKFAVENDPSPLSPEDRHKLTWEGANLRLFESSLMTEAEAEERNKKTGDMARLHMDTMRTGAFFQGLWSRGSGKKRRSSSQRKDEKSKDHDDNDDDDDEPTKEEDTLTCTTDKTGGLGFCKI